jgi:curved DNA-binding protein
VKNYYNILNISKDAESADIRKAFRELALSLHPDVADESHTETFLLVREAYEILIHDDKRKKYDQELDAHTKVSKKVQSGPFKRYSQPAAPAPSESRKVFNKKRSNTTARPFSPKFTQQQTRHHYEASLISAEEAQCRKCDIPGLLEISLEDSLRSNIYTVHLSHDPSNPENTRKYKIQIPGKLYDGSFLRVKGLGLRTPSSIGDLIIEVNFAKHPLYRICGDAIFHDVTITPWHAALGQEMSIPSLDGELRVSIPPILCPPQMKRLQGYGLYKPNGKRGDLWINFKVEIAPPTTFRARRLWAELAEEYRRNSSS